MHLLQPTHAHATQCKSMTQIKQERVRERAKESSFQISPSDSHPATILADFAARDVKVYFCLTSFHLQLVILPESTQTVLPEIVVRFTQQLSAQGLELSGVDQGFIGVLSILQVGQFELLDERSE